MDLIRGETPPPAQPHRAMSLASDASTLELGQSPGTLQKATGLDVLSDCTVYLTLQSGMFD